MKPVPERVTRDFDRSLPMSLLRAREAVTMPFRPVFRRHGINDPQWRVLRVLAEHPRLSASDLARRAAVLSPSLSRMLPVMEARGLLRREAMASDQRRSIICFEPEGRRFFEKVLLDIEPIYAHLDATFGRQRLQTLHDELEALRRALAPRRSGPTRGD